MRENYSRYFAEFVLSYDEDEWWKSAIMKALDHCRDNRTLDKMDWPLGGVAYTKGTTFDAFYRHWERKRTILRPYLTDNGRGGGQWTTEMGVQINWTRYSITPWTDVELWKCTRRIRSRRATRG